MDPECLAYSVGHAGEGVCLLVRIGSHRILLDCGIQDISPLLTSSDQPPADLVLCSHAHADHAQGLLAFHQAFPEIPIYGSQVTTQLLALNWPDWEPDPNIPLCQPLPWDSPIQLQPGLSVIHTPNPGTLVELPIGETFIQPPLAEIEYEGEIAEFETQIHITLPPGLTTDPRWLGFADTGLVEARWQGEELVLRGISQREFLSQGSDRPIPRDLDCCGNCQYYRGQRCWNQSSALYGFKVTSDGYCPMFESIERI
nr:MBL fold metallo-hydrolase [Planktothrix agardhii]